MAIKARVGRMPLTFAVKDVSIDLRAFVQMVDDEVFLRPAGPGESDASTIKLALTGPYSGGSAPMGTSTRDGSKLAIAEIIALMRAGERP